MWSDFHLSECGVNRLLVVNEQLNDYRLGRTVRRRLEIETYRMMASLALPLAKSPSGELQAQESDLAAERASTSAGLPADLLGLYDKLRADMGGIGAAMLHRGACQGCHISLALTGIIFGSFDGHKYRAGAASQHPHRTFARPRKCRQQLHAVEHAQAPAGACSHINQPSARLQSRQRSLHGSGQVLRRPLHGLCGHRLVLHKGFHQSVRVVAIQLRMLCVRCFG